VAPRTEISEAVIVGQALTKDFSQRRRRKYGNFDRLVNEWDARTVIFMSAYGY